MSMLTSQRLRKGLTVALWFLGLGLAVTMLLARPAGNAQGVAWSAPVQLSAPNDGVLLELAVGLHQTVTRGQVVARLDPAPLLAKAEILSAELKALEFSESEGAQGRNRRFETDREDARLDQARLRASIAEERVRLTAIETELAREQRLVADGLRAPAIAEDLELQADVIRTRIEAERSRMSAAAQTLQSATARATAANGPNRWQITAAQRRLDEVYQRLDRLELRSPIDGQTVELHGTPGEWFKAGDPIVKITQIASTEVHVWTDLPVAQSTVVGAEASVLRATGERLSGTVLSVAVERQLIPQSLWYRSNNKEWAYLVRLELADQGLPAGEPVRVSLR